MPGERRTAIPARVLTAPAFAICRCCFGGGATSDSVFDRPPPPLCTRPPLLRAAQCFSRVSVVAGGRSEAERHDCDCDCRTPRDGAARLSASMASEWITAIDKRYPSRCHPARSIPFYRCLSFLYMFHPARCHPPTGSIEAQFMLAPVGLSTPR